MNILFTKDIKRSLVYEILGNDIHADFTEVIAIRHLQVAPFELGNQSLIFSSVNAVKAFFENDFQPDEDFTSPNYNKIFVVGQKTKQELRKHGFGTFKVLRHAAELADFIIINFPKERFVHFCGNLALNILDRKLPLQNIYYKKVVLYQTDLLYPVAKRPFDAVAFFSPSGVRSFVKHNDIADKMLFSIGQTTEKELKKYTDQPIFTSAESNVKDLLQVIKQQISTAAV